MNLFEMYAKISIDSSDYDRGVEQATEKSKDAEKAMQNVQAASTTLQNKLSMLGGMYSQALANVSRLEAEFNKSVAATGATSEQTIKLAEKLDAAERNAATLSKRFDELANLTAETGEATDDLSDKTDDLSDKMDKNAEKSNKLSVNWKAGLVAAAKAVGAAITAAATGISALTKASVEGYADYEQLVGGIETLYGASYASAEEYAEKTGSTLDYAMSVWTQYANRQQSVLDNAANAYKTAGMSANEYMETVSGFAASLNASLGENEWQSANYADMIITDIADNANKMGTDMESVQNAYAGFAKGNFTMLDNLKIGFGGTKEEMERLLRTAEKYEGLKEGAFSVDNFADIADAIHIVQENLGITGTTAKEASETISGSVASMKSAWSNLVVGLADDTQDFGGLVDNFVESAATAAGNLIPRVQKALQGVSQLVTALVPVISEQLPVLVQTLLPSLLTTATNLVSGLVSGIMAALPILAEQAPAILTQLITVIVDNLPMLIDAAMQIITALSGALIDSLPILIPAAVEIVIALMNGLSENLPTLIPAAVEAITTIVEGLIDNIGQLVDAAITLTVALADGFIAALPELIKKAPEIIGGLVEALADQAPKLLTLPVILWGELAKGLLDELGLLDESAEETIDHFVESAGEFIDRIWELGKNIVEGLWQGITDSWEWLKEKVKGAFNSLIGVSEDTLETHSPSKVYARLGEYCAEGFDIGFSERMKTTAANMKAAFNAALGGMTPEEFDKGKTAGGIMALALATGDETLTSMLGQYSTFGELAADLERRAGMSISELYDSMVATQTADDTGTVAADITTATAKATRQTAKTTASTGSSNTEKLLLEIRDVIYQLYNAISSGATLDLFNSALGLDFALATRGDMA